jgi:hypothetical protein
MVDMMTCCVQLTSSCGKLSEVIHDHVPIALLRWPFVAKGVLGLVFSL